MKHIIILGDGMADHPIQRLGGKTLLQCAEAPYMNMLAKEGRCGKLITIPEGFHPGSEVANTAILGYDLNQVYEGRGPLEAASIGYDLEPEDMAMRCNLITLHDGRIITHNGGNLSTQDGDTLIKTLNQELGNDQIKFITGIHYRHLLVVKKASKHVICAPPHDYPNQPWQPLLVQSEVGWEDVREPIYGADGQPTGEFRLTGNETARLLNELILKSQTLLEAHPFNQNKLAHHQRPANSIWPWGGGYRPNMQTLMQMYPQIKTGSVISAVDLIRGIGRYAGLDIIKVPGATGLADTNYEGKAAAAIEALRQQDFVYLHLEATDEAGHDGDLDLKLKAINYLDHRIVEPIFNEVKTWNEPVCIAILPDHPTPVEVRTHVNEPVPFLIWHTGIEPDNVQAYNEAACEDGSYGLLRLNEFMNLFMKIN